MMINKLLLTITLGSVLFLLSAPAFSAETDGANGTKDSKVDGGEVPYPISGKYKTKGSEWSINALNSKNSPYFHFEIVEKNVFNDQRLKQGLGIYFNTENKGNGFLYTISDLFRTGIVNFTEDFAISPTEPARFELQLDQDAQLLYLYVDDMVFILDKVD